MWCNAVWSPSEGKPRNRKAGRSINREFLKWSDQIRCSRGSEGGPRVGSRRTARRRRAGYSCRLKGLRAARDPVELGEVKLSAPSEGRYEFKVDG